MVRNDWIHVFSSNLLKTTVLLFFGIQSNANVGMVNETCSTDNYAFKRQSSETLDKFMPTATYPTNQTSFDKMCIQDSQFVVNAVLNQEEWALSMFHASGNLPFLESKNNLFIRTNEIHYELGHYDQCISSGSETEQIKGQYCLVFIEAEPLQQPYNFGIFNINKKSETGLNLKIPRTYVANRKISWSSPGYPADIIVGLCLPSSCHAEDVRSAVAQVIGKYTFYLVKKGDRSEGNHQKLIYSLVASTHDHLCYTGSKILDTSSHDGLSTTFTIIISIIIGLVLTSAVIEIWNRKSIFPSLIEDPSRYVRQKSTVINILYCFSPMRNVREWLSTKTSPSNDEVPCLHGIRVLTFFTVTCLHMQYAIFQLAPLHSRSSYIKNSLSWKMFPLSHAFFILDNFLVIRGLLTYNGIIKQLNSSGFNIFKFYWHRFFRLTPLYSIILFFIAAVPRSSDLGPYRFISEFQREDCRSYWWSHLLYINNFSPKTAVLSFCMLETWFSSVDMQLFVLSPLFIYPMWRWPHKIGPTLTIFGISVALCYTATIHIKWDVPLLMMFSRQSMMKRNPKYMAYYYINTLTRCPPYLVGILLGWMLNRAKSTNLTIKKIVLLPSWILSAIVFLLIIYGPFLYADEFSVPVINPLFELIYGTFHRTVWSTALACIIFLCDQGYGGIVNDFLSIKKFVPISRLGYAIYLTNFIISLRYISDLRSPLSISIFSCFTLSFGSSLLTLIVSVFLFVVIELPFQNLQKLIFPSSSLPSSRLSPSSSKQDSLKRDSQQKFVARGAKGSKKHLRT